MIQRKIEKKSLLIRAAREVLGRYGFKKTTLDDIAEKAGMAKTSIYYYFKSKKGILIAVAQMELTKMMDTMRDAVENATTPEKKLRGLVRARYNYLQEIKSTPGLNLEKLQEMTSMVRSERERFLGAEIELIKEVILDGVRKNVFEVKDPELFALISISAMRGIDDTFMLYGKHERITEGIEGQMNIIINGIKKR